MRIVITGGNGYLGKRIVKKIVKESEHKVVLILKEVKNLEEFYDSPNVEKYSTSTEDIRKVFESNVDCVLHLATAYGRRGENSKEILSANLIFPLEVLEMAIKSNVKYFFNMDTAIQKLINQYTVTKKQFRDWGEYYGSQEKIRFINMKSEHFYGPFDNEIKFIANMLNQLRSNKPYIETTLGEQKRAFIYIDDIVEAIMCIIKYETQKEELEFVEYQLGPDNNITIKEALNIMKKLTNSKSEIKYGAIAYRKNEEMESKCDNSKLKAIGWKQKVLTFEEGIEKILMEESNNENIN